MRASSILLGLMMLASTPAAAITKQQDPAPSGRSASIADPDERLERFTNQVDRAVRRQSYDPSSARSVMDFGNRSARVMTPLAPRY